MTPADDWIAGLLPLREPTFFILLSLLPGERHGYAILKDVEALSAGSLRLSTGTLYEGLARLLEQELIERGPSDGPETGEDREEGGRRGKPRKTYRLTHNGRKVVEMEMRRMQGLVAVAQRRLDGESA